MNTKKIKPLAHRMPSKTTPKHRTLCQDGPMRGITLWLTDSATATFTYKDQTGRYVAGKWEAV